MYAVIDLLCSASKEMHSSILASFLSLCFLLLTEIDADIDIEISVDIDINFDFDVVIDIDIVIDTNIGSNAPGFAVRVQIWNFFVWSAEIGVSRPHRRVVSLLFMIPFMVAGLW